MLRKQLEVYRRKDDDFYLNQSRNSPRVISFLLEPKLAVCESENSIF